MKIFATILAVAMLAACHTNPTPAPACAAGPDEKCPSALFMADFQRVKSIQKELRDAGIQQRQDEIQGIVSRLQGQIPSGYSWDETKMRFVKIPVQAAPPPPPPPPPPAK